MAKAYQREWIRFAFLFIAIAVFFVGPMIVESDDTRDIEATIEYVKASKAPKEVKQMVIAQLRRDLKFAKENANTIGFDSLKMSAVYWLSLLIIVAGLLGPLIMKYLELKSAKLKQAAGGNGG